MAIGGDEVEATVDPVVFDLGTMHAHLIITIPFKLLVHVVQYWITTTKERQGYALLELLMSMITLNKPLMHVRPYFKACYKEIVIAMMT